MNKLLIGGSILISIFPIQLLNISHFLFYNILDFDLQGSSLQTPSNSNYDHQLTISSLNELTVTSIGAVSGNSGTSQGWMNTVPLSTSATNTLNKRTANNLRMKRQNGNANQDLYVKDYIKKRILILDLLVRIILYYFNII